jgi:hypothetical protein
MMQLFVDSVGQVVTRIPAGVGAPGCWYICQVIIKEDGTRNLNNEGYVVEDVYGTECVIGWWGPWELCTDPEAVIEQRHSNVQGATYPG